MSIGQELAPEAAAGPLVGRGRASRETRTGAVGQLLTAEEDDVALLGLNAGVIVVKVQASVCAKVEKNSWAPIIDIGVRAAQEVLERCKSAGKGMAVLRVRQGPTDPVVPILAASSERLAKVRGTIAEDRFNAVVEE